MLVSQKWLNDYAKVDVDVKEYTDRMIMSGSNLETYVKVGDEIENVVVGQIISKEKHPDADKLNVCMLNVGQDEPIQIVCGAPNVSEGIKVPIALHKSRLPGGVKITKGKLRGVVSNGMICSAGELGFDEKVNPFMHKDGIWILPEDAEVGKGFVEAMDLEDYTIDFEITPNRSDCLSMLGMARETKATFGVEMKYPDTSVKEESDLETKDLVEVKIENNELCKRYVARVVKDVVIKESPWWMQQRLMAAGMRPINNIVDITNFVMIEYGQPIHAFDFDSIESNKIVISNAEDEEKFITLDGKEREVDSSMLMIRDDKKAVGVAGIMGGLNSEIKESTNTVLVEVANFEADNIRLTTKKLNNRTEAAGRFAKGVDPNLCRVVSDRVCHLIEQTESGKVCKGVVDVYPNEIKLPTSKVRVARVNRVLGTDIDGATMKNIFEKLEIKVEGDDEVLICTPPTVRLDLLTEVDYVEEVARLYGYNNLPMTLPKGNEKSNRGEASDARELAREVLCAMGADEIQTYSFVSPTDIEKVGISPDSWENNQVKIMNPLGEDNSVMRTILTPNMLQVLATNFTRNIDEVKAFEIGSVFQADMFGGNGMPEESESMSIGAYGENVDFFTMKGMIEGLLAKFGITDANFEAETEYGVYHPGRCARITIEASDERMGESAKKMEELKASMEKDKESFGEAEIQVMNDLLSVMTNSVGNEPIEIGIFGEVHPDVTKRYGIKTRVYCAELFFDEIVEFSNRENHYIPLPKYPATTRDIAIVLDEDIPVGNVEKLIKANGGDILENVKIFDIYKGEQVEEGKKSAAFSLTYRHEGKTLKDEEVAIVHNGILQAISDTFKASLREI